MNNTEKMQNKLRSLTKIYCPMLECKHCFINKENEDWPDCRKSTTIRDGYLRSFGFNEITCLFFESKTD